MTKSKKNKRRVKSTSFVKNANYATGGAGNNPNKYTGKTSSEETATSRKSLSNARKMAKIEAYAKKHGITVTQAMVHFMK